MSEQLEKEVKNFDFVDIETLNMLVMIRQICHCLKCNLHQNIINGNRRGGYGVLSHF